MRTHKLYRELLTAVVLLMTAFNAKAQIKDRDHLQSTLRAAGERENEPVSCCYVIRKQTNHGIVNGVYASVDLSRAQAAIPEIVDASGCTEPNLPVATASTDTLLDMSNHSRIPALIINANFYAWDPSRNAHDTYCATPLGYAQRGTRKLAGADGLLDTILFFDSAQDGSYWKVVTRPQRTYTAPERTSAAVSGILIVDNGKSVSLERFAQIGFQDAWLPTGRTALGFADGKTVYVVSIQGDDSTDEGATVAELDAFLLNDLHVQTAVLLGGGAARQFSFASVDEQYVSGGSEAYPLSYGIRQSRAVPVLLSFDNEEQNTAASSALKLAGSPIPYGHSSFNFPRGFDFTGSWTVDSLSNISFYSDQDTTLQPGTALIPIGNPDDNGTATAIYIAPSGNSQP